MAGTLRDIIPEGAAAALAQNARRSLQLLQIPRRPEKPMKYSILIYETSEDFAARTDAEKSQAYWQGYQAYTEALQQAGVLVGGAALQGVATATTVRLANGKRQVQDGPFADTREQLGGFYDIEVADLDAALEWAARCPAAATGTVEVRPHLPMG